MTAVTAPTSPPPVKRRWWLLGVVAGWIVVVAVLAVWSVAHERATVPEQRDIGLAVTDLQRAAGVVYAAANGAGRAVVLGELKVERDCRVTPVRSGLVATRTVSVYVSDGGAVAAVQEIAARLPDSYQADAGESRGGTRISLEADAGNFIAIDLNGESSATALSLELSTGCRPLDRDGTPSRADPSAPPAPALLSTVVSALGGKVGEPVARTVTCPSGAVAGSYTVAGLAAPESVAASLREVADGAEVLQTDDVRVYRRGADSLVVRTEERLLSVTVSTGCQ